MKVGVVSDTHNNLKNIETVIKLFNDEVIPKINLDSSNIEKAS